MAIAQIAIIIFIFTLLFIIFSYSQSDHKIGVWICLMFVFSLVLGMSTSGSDYSKQRIHPSFMIAKYSIYNT